MTKTGTCIIIGCLIATPLGAQSWSWNSAPSNAIKADVQCSGIMATLNQPEAPTTQHSVNQHNEAAVNVIYKGTQSRTRDNLATFVKKARATDPAGAAQMEQLFGSTDVIGQIGTIMGRFGLSPDNAADAFTLYWISAWQASHGDTSTPTRGMVAAVSAQAARGLSQSPDFAGASDAQKQEMAEALMVQAAMIDSAVEQAASDPAQMKAIGKAVKQGAAASGLKLDEMTLTEQGFKPAKRKGSSLEDDLAPTPGEAKATEVAAATTPATTAPSTFALIAAAGGAGLGGAFLIGKMMGRKG